MNLMSAPAVFDPPPSSPASSSVRVGRPWLSGLAADSAYVLTGWVVAVISFSVLVTLLASGIGTLVVVVGFPVLVLALFVAQGFAVLERARLHTLTGTPVLVPAYRPVSGGSVTRRVLAILADGRRWLDLLFGVVVLVPSLLVFPIGLAWWCAALTGVLYPLYDWALPHGPDGVSLAQLIGLGDSTTARVGLVFGIGLGAALTLPVVMRGLAMFLSSFGRAMLTRQRAQVLAERVSALTESRAAAVSAEAAALRRLERDLHDGPQQRLIRLAMDLGTAQRRLRTDPESAGPLITGAIEQTRETLEELRALSRGIAPPILADRGLPAALAALAARCPVPVELQTEPGTETPRLAPAVENAAYFLVAEALTNVVKHSGASAAAVLVTRDEHAVRVTVSDNGGGGAHPAKGHGLAGLLDRVRALDGQLVVDSPAGGPTVLAAELPLYPDETESRV